MAHGTRRVSDVRAGAVPYIAVLTTIAVVAACGCSASGADLAAVPTVPAVPTVTASISYQMAPSPGLFVSYLCFVDPRLTPQFDLSITTPIDADLNNVTWRLIDGSSVGGPAITFPSPQLTAQFGTTRIVAQTTRTFRFAPQFVCGPRSPSAVAADIIFIDHTGVAQGITVSRPLQ